MVLSSMEPESQAAGMPSVANSAPPTVAIAITTASRPRSASREDG